MDKIIIDGKEKFPDGKSRYLVAAATSDGETINSHYGKASSFYIYYVDDEEGFDFAEKREVTPVCQSESHIPSQMDKSVKQFADCKYVVASKIGHGAQSALSAQGITGMESPGSVDEAILKIWKYNQIQGLFD
ncbi:MAG: dinitrogenase iron-molybdenum cofactor biosynthesis protein [Treponema sp.]|nr:dinitrogenase iron-molybdenum cofactor biosynthesis protein [Treponema sp.]